MRKKHEEPIALCAPFALPGLGVWQMGARLTMVGPFPYAAQGGAITNVRATKGGGSINNKNRNNFAERYRTSNRSQGNTTGTRNPAVFPSAEATKTVEVVLNS